ncbi:MAG: MFS transporter [Actinomycetota bacterium]
MGGRGATTSLRAALSYRDFRYLLGGLAVSEAGDWLYGIALIVFVFDTTESAAWVAAATIFRTIPYILLGTFGGVLADRYERRAVMIACDLVRGALMLTLAVVAATTESAAAAIGIAFLTAAAATPYGPAMAAMTPSVVGEKDLAAANAATSAFEHVALIVGPAAGGLLLVLGSPSLAFTINAATFLLSALAVAAVRTRAPVRGTEEEESFARRAAEGFRAITNSAEIAVLVGFVVAASFAYGTELVLLVLVATDLLDIGSEGVGYLNAAIGVGGVLAAGLTSRLASSRSPGKVLTLGILASGIPLAALSLTGVPAIAYVLMAVVGVGSIAFDVTTMTLLQRSVARGVIARVFGILDSLAVAGILLGSLAAPLLVTVVGLKGTLVAVGLGVPALVLIASPTVRRLDRRSAERMDALAGDVELLGRAGVFAGAPRQSLEAIASSMSREQVRTGQVVVREGDPSDAFYVIESGRLEVLTGDSIVNVMTDDDHFGEIGLVENIPRTATVRAATDATLLKIDGRLFLDVVNQEPAISGTLLDGIVGRLARTHPHYSLPTSPTKEAT